jgi:hypothetical protein
VENPHSLKNEKEGNKESNIVAQLAIKHGGSVGGEISQQKTNTTSRFVG